VKRLLAWILRPFVKGIGRIFGSDPFERFERDLPSRRFGAGSLADFPAYFQRPSSVTVSSLDDVCDWLLDCVYVSDESQFGVPDHWQHPADFEVTREGDCDDHALWAWRKLTEIGIETEFVVGRSKREDGSFGGHCWVHFRTAEGAFLLEAVGQARSSMVYSLTNPYVREEYVPHFSVDGSFKRHAYWGYMMDWAADSL
jgi:hypothetical protein